MYSLFFTLGNSTTPFEVPPWSYSFSSDDVSMPMCTVAVTYTDGNEDGVTILGDSFLR